MRNICSVITRMSYATPGDLYFSSSGLNISDSINGETEESKFKKDISTISDQCLYMAPEMQKYYWDRLAEIVNKYIPCPPEHQWQKNVIAIFTDTEKSAAWLMEGVAST